MQAKILVIASLFFVTSLFSQKATEVQPPYNIKTASFIDNGNSVYPIFKLGSSFQLQFDDLYGNEANYYYVIQQYNYDWTPSGLAKNEYLNGLDNQRIMNYENSYNTLQQYSHYTLSFPNRFNQITKSGNYLVTILDDANEVVFSKKFILYEDIVSTGLSIRRARGFDVLNEKQNMELVINYGDHTLQNPKSNVKVTFIQNGNLNTSISNVKPQYTLGTELVYRYDSETQFWGGNEFYTLDTSNIRFTNNSVAKVSSGDIYNSHLYLNSARKNNVYTYFPDFNGNFYVNNTGTVENNGIESDYTWVYFSLEAPDYFGQNPIYVNGMFNNYALTDEYKMDYNKQKGIYEKAILIKQGFTNYQYVIADKNGKIDFENAIDGNFYITENNYNALVYYRGNSERYDRIIGRAMNTSENIRN